MSYNIKYLCERFHISRSTLLYYDSIGLLKAADRSDSNYRKYSDDDVKRMEKICIYRQTGLSLKDIKNILDEHSDSDDITEALENRLRELNEISTGIKLQQKFILNMLRNKVRLNILPELEKTYFVDLLYSMGLEDSDLVKLHNKLEEANPEWHQRFLESLSLTDEEIKIIRSGR